MNDESLARRRSVQIGLAAGYAVESRRPGNREIALGRMERTGAILTTTETAAFDLLRDARDPKVNDVQALFKA